MAGAWPPAERPQAVAVARRRALLDAELAGDHDAIIAALDDTDDRVRASAVTIGHRIGALGPAHLIAALDDPSPRVRRSLAATGRDGSVDLAKLLVDEDGVVVETACWAAGEQGLDADGSGGAIHLDALIEICLHHDDALCREAAVAALGAIGADEGLPAILAACRDRPTVRRRAVLALAPFDTPEVDEALAAALDDRDWQVRQAAEDLR